MTPLLTVLLLTMRTAAMAPDPEVPGSRPWAAGLRPEPHLTVSEWADAHRRLPQRSSAEPGPWRTSRTPYLREILDCLSATAPVDEVVMMFGGQLGKSETLLNHLGYIVDHAPGPVLLVQPTVDTAKRFSRQRVGPLFESTPRLAGKVAEVKSRDARGSMLLKEFMGGVLIITGANSAVGLRSMPARYLLLDEIDGYPADVDGEGDPIGLAEARQRTFARRKTIKASTPTISEASAIERAYAATDQRHYFVPCPHCRERQVLEFPRLTWSKLDLPPERAVYLCARCDGRIEERHKTEMLAAGEWRPTAQGENPRIRGYHLNSLYSPVGWLSWGQIATQFVKVHRAPDELKRFTNTVLAETWHEKGEAPEWKRLFESRRESYAFGTVPAGGLFLTAGVDVQRDRLVLEIVAWGRGKASWSVDYGIIAGDTADLGDKGPWQALRLLLGRTFTNGAGVEMAIAVLAVDSGFNTSAVYSFAREFPMSRVIAVKGMQAGGALIGAPSPVEINLRGQRTVRGYKVWPVCGTIAKSELYGFLNLEAPTEPGAPFPVGWCHFPEYDPDYFKQLTAEQLVTRTNRRGFRVTTWELIPGRENHVLDARVYARAAAARAGLDRFTEQDWIALEAAAVGSGAGQPEPPAPRPDAWLRRRG